MIQKKEIYTSKRNQAIYGLMQSKEQLKKEKATLVALEIRQKEEKEKQFLVELKRQEALKKREQERLVLEKKLAKEKVLKRMALAKKLKKEEEKKRLALKKKLEKEKRLKHLALAKKLKLIELEKERLKKLKKESEERKLLTKLYNNEIEELKKIDIIEGEHRTDEVALLVDTKKTKGGSTFKPFDKWFKYSMGYSSNLMNFHEQDSGREALKFSLMANPYSYFFAGVTFSMDVNDYENIYYQPDFSYSFGYSDWHQDTWSFGYANYANNKINPEGKEKQFNFEEGTWDVGYKTKIDDISYRANLKHTVSRNSTIFSVSASTKIAKKTLVSAKVNHHFDYKQEQLVISSKTFLYDKFFVSSSVYLYSDLGKQTDLEPDYAYSFGWKDSRPFHPSITYSNYYTPTRWGGRTKSGPHFENGSLSLSFSLKF